MKIRSLSICLLLGLCLFMTGCGEDKVKTVATLDTFGSVTSAKGFTIIDDLEEYKNIDYILDSKLATYDDIEIEMIQYSDSEYASKVQESQIESFDLLKSTGAYAKKDKGSNYYSYVIVSNNRYMVSTRVDNTLIFCKVMLEDKEIVEEILNELGY